jgi:hypothetical protein
MGDIDLLTVLLAAVAAFAVGAVWYGLLFAKAWQSAVGLSDETLKSGNMPLIFGLTLLFELLMAIALGHNFARTLPPPHVKMMMATGFALAFIIPALGVNYLYQRKSGALFLIDAGHWLAALAAMGGVFVAMG